MHAYLHCLSHTPLVGYVDPEQTVLDEVNGVIADARARIAAFDPELVVLYAPDHYNGFFYDVMPPFCLGAGATSIGDFTSAAGELPVPKALAEACAHAVIDDGIDLALSYCMQVDHGFAQPLEFLLGGLDTLPVLPVFINGVAAPLPGFRRTRMLGEAVGRFLTTLDKRVLILASGGLSHQPPVPELAKADAHMRDRLLGSGKHLPPDERELRQQRVIGAAKQFVHDQNSLHPLNPIWDTRFMSLLEQGRLDELDAVSNEALSAMAGKSAHEIKTWMAAFATLSAFGSWRCEGRYYRPIPEWIAGFGSLSAAVQN
ncbi:MAG: 2,3-dihydroxyphenylpropionate/2,3-dihydroxicinnamic acid 1,2-dioxygenase [Klebsiella michiganensis]|nr:3-carboxyethylcatechol 2,3-dioxygenase [Pluralibacter gergoviae]ELK5592981.1 3-carboxyethylcatechol 2,3-dioxygenase [Pluralibacter gergoviae]MDU4390211.1 2,3-dihydroxyphenylpropionate/2,3-dihydroxicinnamic acid 1,2-dioxygenase [Klebsiella michiganensis]MDU4435904.1 2,3-dihydroxyphenylpropionate/2,3-dihydroxicinnamic acid 1,2-dioxygenase [Pluralibacter gergoviae]